MVVVKRSSKPKRKIYLIVALAVALLTAVGGGYSFLTNRNKTSNNRTVTTSTGTKDTIKPPNTVDYTPSSPGDSAPSDAVKNPDSGSSSGGSATSSLSVTITRASNSGSSVIVSSLVTGASTGTCTLTATQSGQSPIVISNSVVLQGNEYVCPNFTIPYSQFPSGGNWQFKLELASGSKTANTTWGYPVTINK